MPAARHFSRSSLMTFAVSAMMGRRLAPRLRFQLANAPRCGEAVHHRHLAVHQHGIEVRGGHAFQGFGAVVRNGHLRGEILQRALRHALIHRIVLDQEDLVAAKGRQRLRRGFDVGRVRCLAGQHLIHQIGQQGGADGLQADGIRAVFAIRRVMFGAEQGHQNEAAGAHGAHRCAAPSEDPGRRASASIHRPTPSRRTPAPSVPAPHPRCRPRPW